MSIYSSFYGNITNNRRSQFQFDKIYSNRREMDICCGDYVKIGNEVYKKATSDNNYIDDKNKNRLVPIPSDANIILGGDGVFIGRYVLIEYDDWSNLNQLDENRKPIIRPEGEHQSATFWSNYNTDANTYQLGEQEVDENGVPTGVYRAQDCAHGRRGYDSTVWQKVFNTAGKEQYIKIADLNSITPTFNFYPLPPGKFSTASIISTGMAIKSSDSTNVDYAILTQTPYTVNLSTSINSGYIYNEDNLVVDNPILSSSLRYIDSDENDIDRIYYVFSTSDKIYYGVDENAYFSTAQGLKDTKDYAISLPSLGKLASRIWDIIYPLDTLSTASSHNEEKYDNSNGNGGVPAGPEPKELTNDNRYYRRNTSIGRGNGAFSGAGVSTAVLNTVVGDINTFLDLLGEVPIVNFEPTTQYIDFARNPKPYIQVPEDDASKDAISAANRKTNYIYWNQNDGKYYIITSGVDRETGDIIEYAVDIQDFNNGNQTWVPTITSLIAKLYQFLYQRDGYRSLSDLLSLLDTYIDTVPKIEYTSNDKTIHFFNAGHSWLSPEWIEEHDFRNLLED